MDHMHRAAGLFRQTDSFDFGVKAFCRAMNILSLYQWIHSWMMVV